MRDKLESKEGTERINKVKKIEKIADKLGISIAQLSLAWCLKNENVSTVILGATSTKQLDENVKSLDHKNLLDDGIMERVEKILKNKPSPEPDLL